MMSRRELFALLLGLAVTKYKRQLPKSITVYFTVEKEIRWDWYVSNG